VPSWLAARVGQAGQVLATDIDVSWLVAGAGYQVRRHDVGAEPPPGDGFDLVHARLVLVHVPQRAAALAAMVASLRPGGWLLVEEADPALQPLVCPDESGPAPRLANKLKHDFRTLMAQRGVDLAYGRTVPRLLRDAGLADVAADAFFPIGGPACTALEQATVARSGTGWSPPGWPPTPRSTGTWATWRRAFSTWPRRRWSPPGVAGPRVTRVFSPAAEGRPGPGREPSPGKRPAM
jgi:SAM-dependent methyltransferase